MTAAVDHTKLRAPLSGTEVRGRGRGVSPLSLAPTHSGRGIPGLIAFPQWRELRRFGERVYLSPLRFRIAFALAARAPERFSETQIADLIWADDPDGGSTTVGVHLRYLRPLLLPLRLTIARQPKGNGISAQDLADLNSGLAPVTRPFAGQPLSSGFRDELAGAVRAVPADFGQPLKNLSRNISDLSHQTPPFRDRSITEGASECRSEKSDNSWIGGVA